MLKYKIRQYIIHCERYFLSLLLCLITLLFTFPKHTGFVIIFVFLFLIPWAIVNAIFMAIKTKGRKERGVKLLLWLATCSASISHHLYLEYTTEAYALKVSNAVFTYHQNHGYYPSSLEELSFKKSITRQYGLSYSNNDGRPLLLYRATWIIFDVYTFDFEKQKWRYQPS